MQMTAPGLVLDYKVHEKASTCAQRGGTPQGGARHVQPLPTQTWVLEGPGKVVVVQVV